MNESPNSVEVNVELPTLRELLEGYRVFNEWEEHEEARVLPFLSVKESLRQYFELRRLARALAGDNDQVFLEQNATHWIELHERHERIATATKYGQPTRSPGRDSAVSH